MNTLLRCLYQGEGITHFAKVLWLLISFCGCHLRVAAEAVLSCSRQQSAPSYLPAAFMMWPNWAAESSHLIPVVFCVLFICLVSTCINFYLNVSDVRYISHVSSPQRVSGWSGESTIYTIKLSTLAGAGIKYSPAGGSRRPWIRHRISQYVRQNLDKYKSQPRTRGNFEKILFLSEIGLLLTVLNMRIKQRSRAQQ